jgi:RecA/RadA recombinase
MGLLADRFRAQMQKTKNPKMEEASADVLYSTGFLPLDYLNGVRVRVNKPNGESYTYDSIGLVDGSANSFIGRSGSGKTTIAIQAAANIIRPFPNAVLFFDDIEASSNLSRRELLTRFTPEELEARVIYRNSAITAENFYERIEFIYDEKMSHKDEYEYNTGLLDSRGNQIYKLVPTVYLLDSLAMLTPDKVSEAEDLGGQMSATAMAKTNTAVFKRIIPKLKAANIILLTINHINDKIEINAFTHTKSQIGFLRQGETLPGGKAALYLANNMIRVDDGSVLKESEGLGVYGKVVDFSFIKSRTNASGKSVPMIFTFDHGFDEILSVYIYLKSTGAIEIKGSTCVLRGYEDMKFSQKNFKEKLSTDPQFAQAFSIVARQELEKLLSNPEEARYKMDEGQMNLINSIVNS